MEKIQIRVAPQDVIVSRNKTREKRMVATLKMNLENLLKTSLRKRLLISMIRNIDLRRNKSLSAVVGDQVGQPITTWFF